MFRSGPQNQRENSWWKTGWRREVRRWLPNMHNLGRAIVLCLLATSVYVALEKNRPGWYTRLPFVADSEVARHPHTVRAIRGGHAMRHARAEPDGNTVSGRVNRIRDAGTIELEGLTIRLAALQCAENGTAEADDAKRRMAALASGQELTCSLSEKGDHERPIGSCFLSDGRDIADIMIEEEVCRRW